MKIFGLFRYLKVAAPVAAMAVVAAIALPAAASQKRGVSENQFSIGAQLRALTPAVKWYYNWGNRPGAGYNNEVADFTDMYYVPMCWNDRYDENAIRAYFAAHPDNRMLLGFNEPNFKKQANMTPQQAAEAWTNVRKIATECGAELVAPALNYSPDAPYNDPIKWMDEFVALVGTDAFDYTAIHCYGGTGVLIDLATKFHDKYGKDVLVTEFCYWPGEQSGVSVTPAGQIASMVEALEWLETTPWIKGYAWFKAIGESDKAGSPNYGLLEKQQGLTESTLSEQGLVYCHLWDFDPEVYHAAGTVVSATNYHARTNAGVGRGANPDAPLPIEIASFNAGATLDYQFDVPEAGAYNLVLKVTGIGEPDRFDPTLGAVAVNADGSNGETLTESKKFTLPGNETDYNEIALPMTLKAGKQTIRLIDGTPYSPSGIRISTVQLASQSGVTRVDSDGSLLVDVFSADGIMRRHNVRAAEAVEGLPAGLYIAGGRKIAVK